MPTSYEVDISMISIITDIGDPGGDEIALWCETCPGYDTFPPPTGTGVVDWVDAAVAHVREHHVIVIEADRPGWAQRNAEQGNPYESEVQARARADRTHPLAHRERSSGS